MPNIMIGSRLNIIAYNTDSNHVEWNVKHGRQLNGLRSKILLYPGNLTGKVLPNHKEIIAINTSGKIINNESILFF